MVEHVELRTMIAVCESYLRDTKGYKGKIIFDERLLMTAHRLQIKNQFTLHCELYNVATQYYKNK
jgi:hypothetical protein